MQEQPILQQIPVKIYRTADRLMVAAPMPGLQPEDILVEGTRSGHLILQGEVRGLLKDVKALLLGEWTVGGYYRDLGLPTGIAVDGEHGTVTYGNGVVVVALPSSDQNRPARLTLQNVGVDHGIGHGSAE